MSLTWTIKFAETALKDLKKLNKKNPQVVKQILAYLDDIENLEDPRSKGKLLVANLNGRWRYRVGDYRIICEINQGELIITALNIAHRSKVYM